MTFRHTPSPCLTSVRSVLAGFLLVVTILVAGCGPNRTSEPTNAPPTPTAIPTTIPPTPVPTVGLPPTPTPAEATVAASPAANASTDATAAPIVVEFWTTDNEPNRLAAYEAVADRFMAAHPTVELRIMGVDESAVMQQLAAAAAQGTLPDLIRVGIERVAAMDGRGWLDTAAATAVIDRVGRDDFRSGPLAMVTHPETGQAMAVPYDGWLQAIWFRRDLFEQAGLQPPSSWDAINAACDALPGVDSLSFALTLPTAPDQTYTHQVFEQIALSNSAWPLDPSGQVTFNTPEMIEALRFYSDLQRCAQPDGRTLYDAREQYERAASGMLVYSTYIMDDLVDGSELPDGGRVELAVQDLAQRTGFSSSVIGPQGVATFGQLATLAILSGITPDAVTVAEAEDVAAFFLTDGYFDILATAPLGKVPVLDSATETWSTLSPVFANYSPATLGHIANGFDVMNRWVFRPEYTSRQRALVGAIEEQLLIPQAIYNIAVDGSMTPESAAAWLQTAVETLQAEVQQ